MDELKNGVFAAEAEMRRNVATAGCWDMEGCEGADPASGVSPDVFIDAVGSAGTDGDGEFAVSGGIDWGGLASARCP